MGREEMRGTVSARGSQSLGGEGSWQYTLPRPPLPAPQPRSVPGTPAPHNLAGEGAEQRGRGVAEDKCTWVGRGGLFQAAETARTRAEPQGGSWTE